MKDTSFSQTFGDCEFILFMLFLPVSLPVRFPVEGLDERIHCLYNSWNLVLLQSVGEEGIERHRVELALVLYHDEKFDVGNAVFVAVLYAEALMNKSRLQRKVLYVGRCYLVAAKVDDIILAPDVIEVALMVEHSDVTGDKVAVLKHRARQLRFVVIPLHHQFALGANLSFHAGLHR